MNVALAIIIDEKKILIGKIKAEKLGDYSGLQYVFPCESIQNVDCAEVELVKEVKRQTGLDIKVVEKIGERIHPSTQNNSLYFLCEKNPHQTIDIAKDIDVESFLWVDIVELQSYMPTLFHVVKDYLSKKI
jgi:hypothetical protein